MEGRIATGAADEENSPGTQEFIEEKKAPGSDPEGAAEPSSVLFTTPWTLLL